MSGFCGFTGNVNGCTKVINEMTERIKHRGPDRHDSYSDENITLGFRGLNISDTHVQPVTGEGLILTTDGENPEEILRLYKEYNVDMLRYLRGVFSFALYDANKGLLFAARDRFGVKPFYYTLTADGCLLFGSEIKSFLAYPSFKPELNEYALEQYLTFQYSVLDETFFKGVYKLPPAHYLVYKDGKVRIEKYYNLMFTPQPSDLDTAVNAIEAAVSESLELTKIPGEEVGSFLSGGVDSGYIASHFKSDKTFTVGFDQNQYSEIEYAKELSDQLEIPHISKIITSDEYFQSLPAIQYHMDEPLADPAAVAFYFAGKLAAEHVKTALSGEGPDELFGGYNIYREPLSLGKLNFLPWRLRRWISLTAAKIPFSFKGKSYLIRAGKTVEERFVGNARIFAQSEREKILKSFTGKSPEAVTRPLYDEVRNLDDITKMQYIDIRLWLVGDILLQADKMSMAHSLDVRTPYLTMDILNIALKLPVHLRVNKANTKFAFRKAAQKYLPRVAAERKKLGFPVPIRVWLREEKYCRLVKAAFNSDTAKKYFHTQKLDKLLEDHRNGAADNSRKIWTVYSFLVWYDQFFSA